MRTYVYVDGFNLYYRALKDTPYRWLDLAGLTRSILKPHHDILKIRYFTARVIPRPNNPNQADRQNAYLRAIQSHCKEVEVHFGHFLSHNIWAQLVNPTSEQRFAQVVRTEEKGSDVNLAVHLLNDAWMELYDCAVVLTNDSDIMEAMRLVKKHTDKQLGLLTPGSNHRSQQLWKNADFHRYIRNKSLKNNQLPTTIPGTTIHKPENW